ncbi:MAG: histidine--tRNA ligase [Clostridia bacterium]|nr:histidine--tRNA ligase [Clostridia bacterium]
MNITKQKGTKDIMFKEVNYWQKFESVIKEVCDSHNFSEIRVPTFEATELFSRSVGDGTDIVTKEMYTFKDRGDRSITLRPEFTAGVVRAYVENGLSSRPSPVKLWYAGPVFRYEKMQKGRYREFRQFGVEIFGSSSYLADIESITVAKEILEKLGIYDDLKLKINSIGCKECRAKYIETLREYLKDKIDNMCDDCKVRYEKNIMRIIDCKEDLEVKKEMPMITDYLCEDCKKDFENLQNGLKNLGIEYEIDKKIVRGLDYYNKAVFEFASKDLDLSVGGGGRYDLLVDMLGGAKTPATGFAFGMDRIVLLLEEKGMSIDKRPDIFFIASNGDAYFKASILQNKLRKMGLITDIDICERSFSSQMKYASKINARFVIIIGEDEIKNNIVTIKNLDTGNQFTADFDASVIMKSIEIM